MISGHTPLMNACHARNEPLAHYLLDALGTSSAAQRTYEGATALHYACQHDLASVALRLIAIAHVDVSAATHKPDSSALPPLLNNDEMPKRLPLGSTPKSLCGDREGMKLVVAALTERLASEERGAT